MRNTYIKPIIEVEIIEAQDIIAQSPQVEVKDPFEEKPVVPTDPDPTDNPSIFGAKRGNTWFDDTDW